MILLYFLISLPVEAVRSVLFPKLGERYTILKVPQFFWSEMIRFDQAFSRSRRQEYPGTPGQGWYLELLVFVCIEVK